MKKVVLFFALIVGFLTSASTMQAQVNMSRYITLTVKKDSAIKLDFSVAAVTTPIRIVSGSNTQDITAGTGWIGTASYTAADTTMTVYGDITDFNCSNNGANLTALDISNNTQLKRLDCSFNTLSSLDVSNNTQLTTLDCSYNNLNSLDISNNTQLYKLYCSGNKLSSLDVSNNTQLTHINCYSNTLSSLDVSNNTQLKELICSSNPLSSLDVSNNTQLKELICWGNNFSTQALDDIYCSLPDRQASDNARIQPIYSNTSSNHAIVLATNKTNAIAKNWKVQYTKDNADIATTGIYVCGTPHPEPNMSRYITLTVKKDSAIKLDFAAAAAATPVRIVSGSNTRDTTVGSSWIGTASYTADDTTMTVYGDLKGFDCRNNGLSLTAIDISKNEILTRLYCHNNKIRNLDISKNTELEFLHCINNLLTTLDVSRNTKLQVLCCNGNDLSTQTLDDIYCALPDRTGKDNGAIYPVSSDTSSNHAIVLATNKQNAIAKNWKVQYYENDTDIPATTGKHKCSATTDIAEASAEPQLTLYPNPVADMLYLSATARSIRVYDIYGIEVAHATDTDRIDVAHLPAGVYTVRADGTVAKMVKR